MLLHLLIRNVDEDLLKLKRWPLNLHLKTIGEVRKENEVILFVYWNNHYGHSGIATFVVTFSSARK